VTTSPKIKEISFGLSGAGVIWAKNITVFCLNEAKSLPKRRKLSREETGGIKDSKSYIKKPNAARFECFKNCSIRIYRSQFSYRELKETGEIL
jgi:hypothetical protein